jgi:hypothetical protein
MICGAEKAVLKRVIAFLVLFPVIGCGGEAVQVIKESVDAVRPKEYVVVQVRLDASEPPSDEDLKLRRELEDEIEVDRIGRVGSTGAGIGYFDLEIEVDSTVEAVPKIERLLRARGLRERSMVRVTNTPRQPGE